MTTIEQQVLEAAAKIVSDFGSHDKNAYFSNFGEDATFVFYTHPVRLESRADYEHLWNSWEGRMASKCMAASLPKSWSVFLENHLRFLAMTLSQLLNSRERKLQYLRKKL